MELAKEQGIVAAAARIMGTSLTAMIDGLGYSSCSIRRARIANVPSPPVSACRGDGSRKFHRSTATWSPPTLETPPASRRRNPPGPPAPCRPHRGPGAIEKSGWRFSTCSTWARACEAAELA